MTAEEYIEQLISAESTIEAVARRMERATVPEFSNEPLDAKDAAKLTGLPEGFIKNGIAFGWFPVGRAVKDNQQVTGAAAKNARFYCFPRKIWEQTGHVWKGKEALNGN